jgi:FtsP/CotA-like multicopper oxidase with cupredoxin domain
METDIDIHLSTTTCPVASQYTSGGQTHTSTISSLTTTSTVTTSYLSTITITRSVGGHGGHGGHGGSGSHPGGYPSSQGESYSSNGGSGWGSWGNDGNGQGSSSEGGATGGSSSTLTPVPYGSYTPEGWSSKPTPLETIITVTDVFTTYTTVCPVTSHFTSGGKQFTSTISSLTTTSTVTSSYQSTITITQTSGVSPTGSSSGDQTAPISGSATPNGPGSSKAVTTAPYPTGNSTAPYGSGSGTGTAVSPTKNSTCSAPTATASCVPCAGQPSNNWDKTGDNPFCGYTINDNPYEVLPQTCQTREYNFEITNTTASPDGIPVNALLINGQMPGPLIEANWGDWIVVHVKNSMQNNGSTVHWHGLRQNYTNDMDGVASITQCPIAPGETFTYKFRADNYGTSWYHSHFSLQAYEGVFGPIIIHGPSSSNQTWDEEQMIVLQDWAHVPVDSMYDAAQTVGSTPQHGPRTLDTGLINGMNIWGTDGAPNATGKRFEMTVKKGSTYRFRLVNAAIQSTFKFYIDGHKLTVISADFVPIVPYQTEVVSISNGQRYDVLVTFDQAVSNYWMRSDNAQECATTIAWNNIKGIIRYDGAGQFVPTSTAWNYSTAPGSGCADEPLASLIPYYKLDAGSQDATIDETVTIAGNGGSPNLYKWSLSGTTFVSQYGDPTLYSIYENGTIPSYSGRLAIEAPTLNEWVYLIIDSPIPFPHPIHLHGHDFYILAQGTGMYNSGIELNLKSPPRRDVAMMPWNPAQGLGGHLVIAWKADNPGAWLVHCHIG